MRQTQAHLAFCHCGIATLRRCTVNLGVDLFVSIVIVLATSQLCAARDLQSDRAVSLDELDSNKFRHKYATQPTVTCWGRMQANVVRGRVHSKVEDGENSLAGRWGPRHAEGWGLEKKESTKSCYFYETAHNCRCELSTWDEYVKVCCSWTCLPPML